MSTVPSPFGRTGDGAAAHRPALREALLAVDGAAAERVAQRAAERLGPVEVVDRLVAPVLDEIGSEWDRGTVSLAQVYMAGRICERIVARLLPPPAPHTTAPVAVAAFEDHHLLGRRIVLSVLRAAGIPAADWRRVDAEEAVRRARRENIRVLLLSVLVLPSALRVSGVVESLRQEGVRVAVGGAPFRFDPGLGAEVGADAVGTTAADAVHIVRRLKGGPA